MSREVSDKVNCQNLYYIEKHDEVVIIEWILSALGALKQHGFLQDFK